MDNLIELTPCCWPFKHAYRVKLVCSPYRAKSGKFIKGYRCPLSFYVWDKGHVYRITGAGDPVELEKTKESLIAWIRGYLFPRPFLREMTIGEELNLSWKT